MGRVITMVSHEQLRDLNTFVSRSNALANEAVRLVADGSILAAFVLVLAPRGFNDTTPTVLGMRAFEMASMDSFDIVVPVNSLVSRLTSTLVDAAETVGHVDCELPHEAPSVQWQVGLPPREGWSAAETVADIDLERVSREGIAEVKKLVSDSAEEYYVRRVRSAVWGASVSDAITLPAGVAFAATSLGFLGDGEARVSVRAPWVRLVTSRGNVLAKTYAVD